MEQTIATCVTLGGLLTLLGLYFWLRRHDKNRSQIFDFESHLKSVGLRDPLLVRTVSNSVLGEATNHSGQRVRFAVIRRQDGSVLVQQYTLESGLCIE